MFRSYRAIITPYYKNRFFHFQYILGSQILYKGGMILHCCVLTCCVLIVRPDDGPIGPKHVALYVLLMVIIDVLDKNINILLLSKLTDLRCMLRYQF
jgi:hypothetical protein